MVYDLAFWIALTSILKALKLDITDSILFT